MKILVLSHISELVGGAEKSLLDLFDLWTEKHDIEPEFILRMPVGTLGQELKDRGWKYYAVDYTCWSESNPPKTKDDIKNKSLKNTKAVVEIEQIIKKNKPDLVLTNSVVCPWAALAAQYQNVPHAWFVREYGDLDHGRVFDMGRKKTWEDVDSLSSLVITNSQALAKHIKKYIDSDKVTTLYHPFNLVEINNRAQEKVKNPFKNNQSLKVILTAGSLTVSKGVKEAIEAVGRLNMKGYKTEICLVGRQDNRPYLQEIDAVINKYEIKDKVHFIGWQKNPLAYVAKADVGIMSSKCEAFGRVTFEYLAIGKPTLGTNSGGTPEMVKEGSNGYLFERGDIDRLVEGLEHYAKNHKLLKAHGKNAKETSRQLVNSEFNAENLFARLEKTSKIQLPKARTTTIHYESRLSDYERFKKELSERKLTRIVKGKLKTGAGRIYRRGRSFARRIVKGY